MTTALFFPALTWNRFFNALTASFGPSSISFIKSQISILRAQFSPDSELSVACSRIVK